MKTIFTTGEAVGLAEWIIDDICLVWSTSTIEEEDDEGVIWIL